MSPEISPAPAPFIWATGIENTFVPQTRAGMRSLDEYALTQHYDHWRSDFDLVADTGVSALRWGIPWYRVQPTPTTWDWRWTDQALDYLITVKGITPILDLMHYGTPLWLDNSFINASYPQRVAHYAAAVAERYGSLVQVYTPLNEPTINAHLSGRLGQWPPYLVGEDGYYKVLLALARGMVLTTRALRSVQPDALLVQVEAVGYRWTVDPRLAHRTAQENAAQFLAFDLARGRVDASHILYPVLREHGVGDHELAWFHTHAVDFDVLGANFYPWSYSPMASRGEQIRYLRHVTPGAALGEVLRYTYAHAGMPIMVTETSADGDHAGRGVWMDDTVAAVAKLCHEGLPVIGYTWFPFFSMYRWECRPSTRALDRYLIHLGLYDLVRGADRRLHRTATPLVARYQEHIARPIALRHNPLGKVFKTKLQ
jgi:beta-glucosidase/6-phospho-beta-glucosidase/beta-galactosidase